MSYIRKNIFAVLRGNIVCGWNRLLQKCRYKNPIRLFHSVEIDIDKGAKLFFGGGGGNRCMFVLCGAKRRRIKFR